MRATIDEAGRVQLPEEAREQLGLRPGSEVEVRVCENGLEITAADDEAYLAREGDFWVIVTPESAGRITADMTNGILEKMRDPIRRNEDGDE